MRQWVLPELFTIVDIAGYLDDMLEQTGPYSKTPWFSVADLALVSVQIFRGVHGFSGALAPKVTGFGNNLGYGDSGWGQGRLTNPGRFLITSLG